MRKYPFVLLLLCAFSSLTHAQNNPVRLFGQTSRPQEQVGYGSIYSINPDGTDFQTHKVFAPNTDGSRPRGRILKLTDGSLMGMTSEGGANDLGVIFKLNADGTGYTKVLDLTYATGAHPSGRLIQATDGKVYGTMQANSNGGPGYGTIFRIDADGTNFTKLHAFQPSIGANPWGGLLEGSDGRLYGTTAYGTQTGYGTVYGINKDGTEFQQLYAFDGTGAFPRGDLIEGADGFLYGMSESTSANGTIFKIEKDGTDFQFIHHFAGGDDARQQGALLQLEDNTIIGIGTQGGTFQGGVMFKIQPDGSDYTILHQFTTTHWPSSIGLTSEGKLYSVGLNEIFIIDTDGTNLQTLSMGEFDNHGVFCDVLETSPGTFIGVAREGGTSNNGGIFKVSNGTPSILKEFPQEGADPHYEMMLASNGSLYGKTTSGGEHGFGTLFKIEKDGTGFTHLYQFESATYVLFSGESPGGLVEVDGFLYGVTANGLYKVGLAGNNFAHIYTNVSAGEKRVGDLCLGPDGFLYFITSFQGGSAKGHLYKVRPNGTDLTTIVDFANTESQTGSGPSGFRITDGNIYLTTTFGGLNFAGVLSKISLDGSTITKILDLDWEYYTGITQSVPLLASDGKLYGKGIQNNAYFSVAQDGSGFTTYPSTAAAGGFGSTIEPILGKLFGVSWNHNIHALNIETGSIQTVYQTEEDYTINGFSPRGALLGVEKQAQTLTLDNIPDKHLGDAPSTLSATSSHALVPITFTSSNTAVITVSGNTLTVVGAGTTVITARQAGSITISDASDQQTVRVFGEPQSITFGALPAKIVTDDDFTLSATATSGLTVAFSSSDPQVATITGSTVHIVGGGETTITASQPGNSLYDPAENVEQILVVNKLEQEITFGPLSTKSINDDDFDLVATASSQLAVSYESSNIAVATVSGSTVSIVGTGTTTITASQPGNSIFSAAESVEQTLEVTKALQEIAFSALEGKTFGDEAFALPATSTSGLPVTFTSSESGVATINGMTVTITGAGTTSITASQAGNDVYAAATSVTRTLEVAKAPQSIMFNVIANKTLGDAPLVLEASSTSNLPVVYSSTSDKITVNGNTVTLVKAGRPTVIASQVGNNNYEAADAVQQSFCINPAKPVITTGPGVNPTLTSSNDIGNRWFSDGTAITDATGKSYTPTEDGTYTVQTTVDDCASEISESVDIIVTGLNNEVSGSMSVYPNPVLSDLFVEMRDAGHLSVTFEVFDALGSRVSRTDGVTNSQTRISMEDHGPGIYFLKASSGEKIRTSRVVKK